VPGYHQRHVLRTLPAKEPTSAMDLGTALHFAVLEPDKFLDHIVCLPFENFRTKAAQAARDFAEGSGKLVVTKDQHAQIAAMRDSILDHSESGAAIRHAEHFEYAIRWQDESGLWVRNLIDALVPSIDLLVNIKTAADPSPKGFARAAGELGYHRSSALYVAGARAALGMTKPKELFVVVGKEAPYEVACYFFDAQDLAAAERSNREDLDDLARRRVTGDWSSRHAGKVETVELLPWAR
jgi:exodeoxyribonuclease VIII